MVIASRNGQPIQWMVSSGWFPVDRLPTIRPFTSSPNTGQLVDQLARQPKPCVYLEPLELLADRLVMWLNVVNFSLPLLPLPDLSNRSPVERCTLPKSRAPCVSISLSAFSTPLGVYAERSNASPFGGETTLCMVSLADELAERARRDGTR